MNPEEINALIDEIMQKCTELKSKLAGEEESEAGAEGEVAAKPAVGYTKKSNNMLKGMGM